jgi:formate/nitrite transporter FocA (FNT family)
VDALPLEQPRAVTLGNVVGGALMVGAVHWFVYLRGARIAGRRGGS